MITDYDVCYKEEEEAIARAREVRVSKKRTLARGMGLDILSSNRFNESQLDIFIREVTK